MKVLISAMALVMSFSVFANCNQAYSRGTVSTVQMHDGSSFVSYDCQTCPASGLVNFCGSVARSSVNVSVKAVDMAVDRTGNLTRTARCIVRGRLGILKRVQCNSIGLAKTAGCFVKNTVGVVRKVGCNSIGGVLGIAHDTAILATRLTSRVAGRVVGRAQRMRANLRDVIFRNNGNVCGCTVGTAVGYAS